METNNTTEASTGPELLVTPEAVKEITRLLAQHEMPDTAGVRVGVQGGGCSGVTYSLNFDYKSAAGDHVIEQDGVRLFCDPKSLIYLRGTQLTFSDGLQGKGFQFINPNAASTCGCGESFSV